MRPPDALDWMRDEDFALDLGDGHWAAFVSHGGEGVRVAATGESVPYTEKAGVAITHRQPRSPTGWCQGAVIFLPVDPHGWTANSLDPLNISPSVLCKAQFEGGSTCDDHGFIKQGRWVRA